MLLGGPNRAMYRPLQRIVHLSRQAAKPRAVGASGVVIGFAGLIVIGTALLSLPIARQPGTDWSLVESLFTAVSAVTVTGLTVVDTGTHWSRLGQEVILALIQAGGLGIMTASMLILIVLRRPVSFRDRFELAELSRAAHIRNVYGLVLLTVAVTAVLESLGALAIGFELGTFSGNHAAWWPSTFVAISAFNNAGFDVFSGQAGLVPFARTPVLLAFIEILVITGGVGVLVIIDVATKRHWRSLTLNTKVVLAAYLVLLVLGFVGILGAEFGNPRTLGPLSLPDRFSNAFFHSVMARTAGFNTLNVAAYQEGTLFLTMLLMFIGGAAGSTAGGIKVSTAAIVLLATWSGIRGQDKASGFGRRIGNVLVYRALAVVSLSMLTVAAATMVLTISEGVEFKRILFEVISAFGTVGLSTGITPTLSIVGKITIIGVMFVGRLGPLSLAYFLAERAREPAYELPEGHITVG